MPKTSAEYAGERALFASPRFCYQQKEDAMKKSDLGIPAVMICTGIAALIKAGAYPAQSRMMPSIYGVALIAFSLLLGLKALASRENDADKDPAMEEEPLSRVFLVVALILGYITSIQALGFYSSTALFLLLFMSLMRAASLRISLAVAATTSLVVYFFFERLLTIPVPEGIFF
jgi:putative tricarboxylic transport membrane protein